MKIFKRGVSMITLVVTIFVMIIIAGTAIISLSLNNPIENAKESVLKTNISQILEEVDIYILSHRREKKKYPVLNAKVDTSKFSFKLKECIAIDNQIFENNGLPSISGAVDETIVKSYYLDKKLIKSAKTIKKDIILTVSKEGYYLYFIEPEIIKNKEIYRLFEMLFEIEKEIKFFAGVNNTFKLYEDGTLTVLGRKNNLSGITNEEYEDMKTGYDKPYKSIFDSKVKKEIYGDGNIFGITEDGKLLAVGNNSNFKLGLGYSNDVVYPKELNIDNVENVYPGYEITFVTKKDGTLWGAGRLPNGNNQFVKVNLPSGVKTSDIKRINSRFGETFLITNDYKMYSSKNGDAFKFVEEILPEKGNIKEIKNAHLGIIILYENGNLYEYKKNKEEETEPVKKEYKLIKEKVKQIGPFDEYIFDMGYISYITNDNKLVVVDNKVEKEINPIEEVNYAQAKLISTSRLLYNGKIYKIGYGDSLEKEYLNTPNRIVEVSEEYRRTYIRDEKNNIYLLNMADAINNKKLVQEKQRKVFEGAKLVMPYRDKIDIIDDKYELWEGYKTPTKINNISKAIRENNEMAILSRNGELKVGELVKTGDKYEIKNPKIIQNVIDVTDTDIFTTLYLTKNGEEKEIYWKGWPNPFKTKTPLVDGKIREFEKANIPGIPKTAERIYATYGACFVVTKNGEMYSYGDVGDSGFTDKQESFRKLNFKHPVKEVKMFSKYFDYRSTYIVVTLRDGSVYAWGHNEKGQFGKGYEEGKWYNTPQKLNIDKVLNVGVGDGFTIYQKFDKSVYGAGRNEYGQLGTGNTDIAAGKFVKSKELSENIK